MKFVKDIIYNILFLQETFLKMRLSRTIGVKNLSKRKKYFSNGIMLDLNALADEEKEKLEAEIFNILKTYNFEPKKILEYVEKQGTKVHYLQESKKILYPIKENEGFICPAKGAKALYLSLAINKKPKLKTDGMFVLSKGEINKYYFIYHFYNWFAYKKGIAGLDSESQELLKRYLLTPADTKELQLDEIYKLKDAIKQDKASIAFVIKLCQRYEGTKNAIEKMKDGGAKL